MISIRDFNKADVLAALYNHSKPQGMGFFQYDPKKMTREEAQEILDKRKKNEMGSGLYFDYLKGRVLKVDLSGDEFEERLYDRDLGNGAAYRAIEKMMDELTKP